MKIRIHNREFSSLKSCGDHVRNLINNFQSNELTEQSDRSNFLFLKDVVGRSPKVENKDHIVRFEFIQVSNQPKTLIFCTRDGSKDSVSWLNCLSGKPKIWSVKEKLIQAFRLAVREQTRKFKLARREFLCALCAKILQHEYDVNVDHIIDFSVLTNNFLETLYDVYPITHDSFAKNRDLNVFELVDISLLQQWQEYHLQHAQFQILCSRCNLTKPKVLHNWCVCPATGMISRLS